MDPTSINLLRTQSVLSPEELILLGRFRFFSMAAIGVILFIGLFVGAAYFAGKLQYDQLEAQRSTLSKTITYQAKKQILLLSLQERIPIIEKTIDSQYPWDKVVENVVGIVAPPFLKTLSIGNNNTLSISAHTNSLEEVESIVLLVLKQTQEKKIRSPQINSMTVGREGRIEISFTFIPIL